MLTTRIFMADKANARQACMVAFEGLVRNNCTKIITL